MGPKCTEHTGTSEPLGCRGGRTHKARSSREWEWSELDQPAGQGNHTPACQGRGAVLRSAEKWGRARPSSSPPAQTYGTASPSKRQCGAHVKKARSTQEAVWPKKKEGRLCQSVCSQQPSTLNSVSSGAQRIRMDHHQDPGHAAGPQNAQSRRARGKRARQQFHEFCSTERRRRTEWAQRPDAGQPPAPTTAEQGRRTVQKPSDGNGQQSDLAQPPVARGARII